MFGSKAVGAVSASWLVQLVWLVMQLVLAWERELGARQWQCGKVNVTCLKG